MRWLFVAVLTLAAVPAAAQLPIRSVGGFMNPVVNRPISTTVNCNTGSNCHPLNAAQCSDTSTDTGLGRTVQITIPPPSSWAGLQNAFVSSIAQLIVWVQKAGTAPITDTALPSCSLPPGAAPSSPTYPIVANQTLIVAQWPFVGNSFTFPDDLNNGLLGTTGNLSITVGDFMKATGKLATGTQVTNACDTAAGGVNITYYVLCFGIDSYGDTGQTGANQGIDPLREPTGWAIFTVDTQPPAAVTGATADALIGRISVKPVSAGKLAGDRWNVKIRPLAAGAANSTDPCNTWTGVEATATADAISDDTVTVEAKNGVAYEGCVDLIDEVGNEGTGSAHFAATPFDQCDFASCYPPNELDTGFCAAVAPVPMAATVLVLLLRRRRHRDGGRS